MSKKMESWHQCFFSRQIAMFCHDYIEAVHRRQTLYMRSLQKSSKYQLSMVVYCPDLHSRVQGQVFQIQIQLVSHNLFCQFGISLELI